MKRLQTDYVDLYQCHRYDWDTPLEETMEALNRAVESGKIRYIGFSEWPAEQIQAGIELSKQRGLARFVSSQPQYSMLWREPEPEVIPLCAANGISQIVWSPLEKGVLSGKYDPDNAARRDSGGERRDRRLHGPADAARSASRSPGAEADRRRSWADACPARARMGSSRAQCRSAIVGASRPEQVRENGAASGVIVDPQLFARAEKILDEALSREPA